MVMGVRVFMNMFMFMFMFMTMPVTVPGTVGVDMIMRVMPWLTVHLDICRAATTSDTHIKSPS